jgi:hypothetical protein
VTDSCKTPSQALEGYIEEVCKWIELAKQWRSSRDVMPVYMPAIPENAADVEKRIKLLARLSCQLFAKPKPYGHRFQDRCFSFSATSASLR